ncbi:MAG: pseudouridine synthase [bacterium]|nr:pseudouridine synthase [bacterium]MDY4108737.1 pseudouridine synthase [Bacilli bacterium]
MERLQKIIALSGYASRRKAEDLIKAGKVMVNGKVVRELGTKASFSDDILIDGKKIEREEKEYYIFNKPRGVITSTSDDKGRKVVTDYFETNKRLYPVGRLDYDTTGLLILTNDGELANLIMHPRNEIEKQYIAKLEGIIKGEEINKLKNGIVLDGTKCIPKRVKLREFDKKTNTSIVEIVICEGKNHEVKRLFESVSFNVLKLKRERIGFLTLGKLKSGEYRKLNPKEVKQLYGLVK